jgi:hypothetical protein
MGKGKVSTSRWEKIGGRNGRKRRGRMRWEGKDGEKERERGRTYQIAAKLAPCVHAKTTSMS